MKRVVAHNPDDDTQSHNAPSAPPVEQTPAERPRSRRQGQSLPPELVDILVPSLKVGAAAGGFGLFTGAAAGIVRSAPTLFFSVITGGQWFTLASSYYAARLVGLNHFGAGDPTSRDKVKASTVAGGVAGSLGGLLRGPRNVIPGAVMFSLFGAGGQAIVNWREAKAANAPPVPEKEKGKGFWAKYSPLTKLTDQDYETILEEKLLRVEAEIAVVDDHIKELRDSERQAKLEAASEGQGGKPASSGSKA